MKINKCKKPYKYFSKNIFWYIFCQNSIHSGLKFIINIHIPKKSSQASSVWSNATLHHSPTISKLAGWNTFLTVSLCVAPSVISVCTAPSSPKTMEKESKHSRRKYRFRITFLSKKTTSVMWSMIRTIHWMVSRGSLIMAAVQNQLFGLNKCFL